jgi:hypothetical protein
VGALSVEANVPGAEVVVNGKVAGVIPLVDPIYVEPGRYGVEVRAPGYEPDAKITELDAGGTMWMRMELEPVEPEPSPAPPEQAPPKPQPAASVPVAASAPPPAPAPIAEEIARRPPAALSVSSGDAVGMGRRPSTAILITGFGLTVVGTAVGIGALVAGSSARDEADARWQKTYVEWSSSPCTEAQYIMNCQELDSTIASAATLQTVGVVGIIGAVGGAALFIRELVQSGSPDDKGSMRASVIPTPGGGVLTITGSF